jgi:hypothetical protein
MASEALAYQASWPLEAFDIHAGDLVDLAKPFFHFWATNSGQLGVWLHLEHQAREHAARGMYINNYPERAHPTLSKMIEGHHWGYTYTERLYGAFPAIEMTLKTPYSRRAWWPIFLPQDAIRASTMTRIPCTLGYHWNIRPSLFQEGQDVLEVQLIQRSCDFDTFWLSDLWLTAQLTMALREWYNPDLLLGTITHTAISLHSFHPDEVF